MRQEVENFISLGPLPDEQASVETIELFEARLSRISSPVSAEEASALMKSFGSHGCFGLSWTLLHLVE